jgi:hypothetical protein
MMQATCFGPFETLSDCVQKLNMKLKAQYTHIYTVYVIYMYIYIYIYIYIYVCVCDTYVYCALTCMFVSDKVLIMVEIDRKT